MTHGSLFSGSGGFDLAAERCGIETLWQSEIEPDLIRVLKKNFPDAAQLGDISGIDGAKIAPVDIISGGSPCQDMSVAGKREGLGGSRSTLFHEQIRIVREMREATNGKQPRYMVWENVPGAFSSSKGEDFRLVLQETIRIASSEFHVPGCKKWGYAGAVMGDGWSIAWRVLDAQFWGVPQRRRRIYLVADFGGESAPEILFDRTGLSGNSAESRAAGQGAAGGCAHRTGAAIAFDNRAQDSRIALSPGNISPALTGKMGTGGGNAPLILDDQGGRNIAIFEDGISPALRAQTHGHPPLAVEPIPFADKATRYKGGGDTRNDDGAGNGLGIGAPGDPANTLTAADRHGVCYAMQALGQYKESEIASTVKARDFKDATDLVIEPEYVVRRFTPLECCRLQGFPDGWSGVELDENPKAADIKFWLKAWAEHWAVIGRAGGIQTPKDEKAVRRWLKTELSDSALYRMWGNGLALPCAQFVFEGIALQIKDIQP